MGILNVTPDSFSDGGKHADPDAAIAHARRMIDEGVDIIDVGGESTRPGSQPVAPEEQIRRTLPVIAGIRNTWDGPISVDTTRATVADSALNAGANWVNDISAFRDDEDMIGVVVRHRCPVVLMHMQGRPDTMQDRPSYVDVVAETITFLTQRARLAEQNAVARENIILDPGIGFGKQIAHNLELMRRLPELAALGYKVLVGVSRKSFIGQLTGAAVNERLAGSLAAALRAADAGASILRVHDVGPTKQALTVARAIATE
jgi:dihydropteroate synthase